ncbi:dnaJ homolog subfamily C member 2 [Impatiens glandulifera]|uniref:dnaJ homolog subfamily C member 2 n=1 Tax=Impatiens glandulifera TaxID=253017 RepID=UPI001FB051E7|nr:dnaJ homolog subfamily C member 2 [Impatiens glandulifera]XP_047310500.1 dnaJ homolog subfamily C member 2 [Impatiens glandulifera]
MANQTGKMLFICYSDEIKDGMSIYVSSNCSPIKALKYEPAGHSFNDAALKLVGFCKEEEVVSDEKVKEQIHVSSTDYSSSSKGKKKSKENQQDHYALLGLGHLRYLATEDQIKKSYRETALRFHPDKQAALILAEETEAARQALKDETENRFKAIQEAYELLTDPVKRRIYDSTDEFDDEIPTDCSPRDFFKVFGPAFTRNGRWSVTQPPLLLGDDSTPIKDVDKFYDFWYSFKSWREFPQEEEHDLDHAETRDERRWMERQNAKMSEKARKDDYARIRSLVDNAYKKDPRIQRRKEQLKAEKLMKKEAKLNAKKQQEEEAARLVEEQKRIKEEEDKKAAEAASNQKKAREKEKKLLRKERTRLRTLSAPVLSLQPFNLTEAGIETLCASLDMEQLKSLCDRVEGKEGTERAQLIKESLNSDITADNLKPPNGSSTVIPTPTRMNGNVSSEKKKPWGKEEIELLRKGIQKYPKGTSRRWEVISEYIGTNRSVEEILKATKTVLLQKPDDSKSFDSFLEKRKPTPSIASPLSARDETEAPPVIAAASKESSASESANNNSQEAAAAADEVVTGDQDVWSAVQAQALIQALKTFPKDANQRWERVAAAVPGKNVNQCKKKLTSMKENFRSKKV